MLTLKLFRRYFASTVLLSVVFPTATMANADPEHVALLQEAVATVSWNFDDSWAYTETQSNSEGIWVGRFDPRHDKDKGWTLVSVDGREPSEDEIEEYLEGKSWRGHVDDGDDNDLDMVQPDTLDLIEETDDYWIFSFVPRGDGEDEDFLEKLSGTLKIIKDGRYLEYIDMRSDGPVKPAMGVKIKDFRTHLVFGPAIENGPIVPKSVDVKIKARAFLVIGINEQELITFNNYEFVGD